MSDSEERARAKQAQILKGLQDSFDPIQYATLQNVVARGRKIAFEAHVAAGFTPEQALMLCK